MLIETAPSLTLEIFLIFLQPRGVCLGFAFRQHNMYPNNAMVDIWFLFTYVLDDFEWDRYEF